MLVRCMGVSLRDSLNHLPRPTFLLHLFEALPRTAPGSEQLLRPALRPTTPQFILWAMLSKLSLALAAHLSVAQ